MLNSCKNVPNPQGYVNANSCKRVHRTFTPENSQSSVIQSSMKREIQGQDRGVTRATLGLGEVLWWFLDVTIFTPIYFRLATILFNHCN